MAITDDHDERALIEAAQADPARFVDLYERHFHLECTGESRACEPERWRQIERIYNLALDRPPREREGFLDSQCHGDQSLRLELDLLLRRTGSAETFLDESAITVAAQLMGPPEPAAMPAQIGRY